MRTENINENRNRKLRDYAEDQLARCSDESVKMPINNPQEIIHKLQVYQIELTMQNEQLRRAQTELDTTRARYFDLYDLAPVGYYTVSENSLILEANLMAATLLGVAKGKLVKQPITRFILTEDQDIYYLCYKQFFKTGEPQVCELRMVKMDGTAFWGRLAVTAAQDAGGATVCHIVLIDITERKLAEGNLLEIKERYRSLFDHSLNLVYLIDFEGRFIDANDAALNRLGYTKEEMPSLNFASLLDEDQLSIAFKNTLDIIETGHQKNALELRLRHKDGTDVYVETQGSVVMYEGKPVAIQAIARDITDRKQAEEILKDTLENLRKAVITTIQVMVSAVETRDPYTSGHQKRVADLARTIATDMCLPKDKIEGIRMAGTIHDVGKLSIPAEFLSKPTKLSELEFSLIKEHSQSGYEILKDVESPWPLAQIVYQHHERMDGSGYPRGLKGEEILMEARIIAVADVVEAMASHRPYRPALGIKVALEEIDKNRGILYDEAVVYTCLRLFREKGYQFVKGQ